MTTSSAAPPPGPSTSLPEIVAEGQERSGVEKVNHAGMDALMVGWASVVMLDK